MSRLCEVVVVSRRLTAREMEQARHHKDGFEKKERQSGHEEEVQQALEAVYRRQPVNAIQSARTL
jgi:hypothetical protein